MTRENKPFMKHRQIKVFLSLFAYMLLAYGIQAQNTDLQKGMENYTNGDYEKALEYLTLAIRDDRTLTSEMLAEAYYYRGLTYIRLYNEALSGNNTRSQKLYKDAVLSAYRDYKASLGYDDGKFWKPIDLEMKNLHHPLLQEGLTSLNAYNQLVYQGKSDPELLQRAEDYLVSAHEIRETYLVCDLLGQVNLDKGLKQEAAGFFSKSEKLYTEKLPEEPDFLMAYVLYRLAAIHKSENIRLALQDDQRGLNLMESEHERFLLMKDQMPAVKSGKMEDQYLLAIKDLNSLKLDLYLSDSSLYVEAIHVFEEELARKPGDVSLMIGYASLLEKTDKEKAIGVYLKALEIDPGQPIALFNTGALYYAKGKDLFETAQKTDNDRQYKILTDEANHDFTLAKEYFEKTLELDPGSIETINALKTIAFILDDQEGYHKYEEMENQAGK
jgi:TPR repeat protein